MLEKTLESPLDCKEIQKEISPGYSLEGMMLKLKLQYFGNFMGNRWGNNGNSVKLYFWGAPKSLQMVTTDMKLKDAYSVEGKS